MGNAPSDDAIDTKEAKAVVANDAQSESVTASPRRQDVGLCSVLDSFGYTVLEKLGQGAYATVFLAREKVGAKQFVAVKVLSKFLSTPKQLFNEVTALKRCRHPNVESLYAVHEDDERLLLVTEYASGGELFDRIVEKGYYSEGQAREVMEQLLQAVCYLHSVNIMHRDLKPENILLTTADSDTDIKLADFGVAKVCSGSLRAQSYVGSLEYMAPEIFNMSPIPDASEGKYDSAVDVWGLGMIAYILLSGMPPYDPSGGIVSLQAFVDQIEADGIHFPAETWSTVSPEAKAFIARLLVVNPARRATCAEALNDPWINPKRSPLGSEHTHLVRKTSHKRNLSANHGAYLSRYNSGRHRRAPSRRRKRRKI